MRHFSSLYIELSVAILAQLLVPAFSSKASEDFSQPSYKYTSVSIPAESLKGNLTGDPCVQKAYVFLPPSYETGQERYPVLYFFAGYHMDSDIEYIREVLPSVMKQREYIVVSVNDGNSLHGSFGSNSPVTGNWNDFFLNEAIPYIDSNFRTIASAEGRAVCGFSMGGHIAIRLAFNHPETFSILYALAPGVFGEKGLENAMHTWDNEFLQAYGAAYAPNLDKPYPHADIPSMDGSTEDMAARTKWNCGFGCLPELLDRYLAGGTCLKKIYLEVGLHDEYPWILEGCVYFNDLLTSKEIAHTFVITNNGHNFSPEIFKAGMGASIDHDFSLSE